MDKNALIITNYNAISDTQNRTTTTTTTTAPPLESIFALRKILLNIRCIDALDKRNVNRFNMLPALADLWLR